METKTTTAYIEKTKCFLWDEQSILAIYLKVRECYIKSVLLESNEMDAKNLGSTYIAFDELFKMEIIDHHFILSQKDKEIKRKADSNCFEEMVDDAIQSVEVNDDHGEKINPHFFGYTGFSAIPYFENNLYCNFQNEIPDFSYSLYKYVIKHDLNTKTCEITELLQEGEESKLDEIISFLKTSQYNQFPFQIQGKEEVDCSDSDFLKLVHQAKENCYQGEVFQLVLSQSFSVKYKGDDMNVYRALRSISPSPFLFYFDFGSFHLFGSSPEAQLIVKDDIAEINPIAGTYKKGTNQSENINISNKLIQDAKENSEHVMLVDLARNDLNRVCEEVQVVQYKKVEEFSHVFHLVSKVQGILKNEDDLIKLIKCSFPAGTLTGAPKYRAIELIREYESISRNFYGGCIGITDFKKNYLHAILIRTFLSSNNQLKYRAGAGIVADSIPENELKEIENKLLPLRKALQMASVLNQ